MGNSWFSIVKQTDFEISYTDEPHASRRKEILLKHPEVKKLYGPESLTKWIVIALVLIQLALMVIMPYAPWKIYIPVVYFIGATINHSLFLAIHEVSHNLAFKSINANRALNMFANLPILLPYSVTFKGYHMEHHRYQGMDVVDTDIPTAGEANFFNTPFRKLIFMSIQLVFYACRPMYLRPRVPGKLEFINWAVQFSFDAVVIYFFGWSPCFYLVACSFVGGGLHPMSGHFIAEHYTFVPGVETYSYYGPLNMLGFNVGYHNEHHDFPYVPWTRLPRLREIAPEFYDNLPQHSSWVKVIWDFISSTDVGCFSRVKRSREAVGDSSRKSE